MQLSIPQDAWSKDNDGTVHLYLKKILMHPKSTIEKTTYNNFTIKNISIEEGKLTKATIIQDPKTSNNLIIILNDNQLIKLQNKTISVFNGFCHIYKTTHNEAVDTITISYNKKTKTWVSSIDNPANKPSLKSYHYTTLGLITVIVTIFLAYRYCNYHSNHFDMIRIKILL